MKDLRNQNIFLPGMKNIFRHLITQTLVKSWAPTGFTVVHLLSSDLNCKTTSDDEISHEVFMKLFVSVGNFNGSICWGSKVKQVSFLHRGVSIYVLKASFDSVQLVVPKILLRWRHKPPKVHPSDRLQTPKTIDLSKLTDTRSQNEKSLRRVERSSKGCGKGMKSVTY